MKAKTLNSKLQAWVDARRRHHLSHAQIQMARELGMNPAKMGELDNHGQERWKLPLPLFIEQLYLKRFGKHAPDLVMFIEDRARLDRQKKDARRSRGCVQPETVGESHRSPERASPDRQGPDAETVDPRPEKEQP